ncbi:hypothetical protein ACFL04_01595 [Patescibacteria group bacterium]
MTNFNQPANQSFVKRLSLGKIEPKLRYIVFILVIVMGLAYIVIINNVATGGFALDDLRTEVDELRLQNGQLELRVANLQSLSQVESKISDLQLVQTDTIEYLDVSGGAVAVQP